MQVGAQKFASQADFQQKPGGSWDVKLDFLNLNWHNASGENIYKIELKIFYLDV